MYRSGCVAELGRTREPESLCAAGRATGGINGTLYCTCTAVQRASLNDGPDRSRSRRRITARPRLNPATSQPKTNGENPVKMCLNPPFNEVHAHVTFANQSDEHSSKIRRSLEGSRREIPANLLPGRLVRPLSRQRTRALPRSCTVTDSPHRNHPTTIPLRLSRGA